MSEGESKPVSKEFKRISLSFRSFLVMKRVTNVMFGHDGMTLLICVHLLSHVDADGMF